MVKLSSINKTAKFSFAHLQLYIQQK